jgi:mannose-6-phosphate isomerase-like protein (cupin superfamily)
MELAAINSMTPHSHQMFSEEYQIISGALLFKIGDKVTTLYENESVKIPAGQIHSASSVEGFALVKIVAQPGRTPEN